MPGRLEFRTTPDGSNVPALRMVIKNDGNVGIGTTTPNNKLQVTGLVNFDDTRASTSLGYQAGNVNAGNNNTFVGYQSGFVNDTGANNTATGNGALYSNATGSYNTASGMAALYYNIGGHRNTANGLGALWTNTSGQQNTASGVYALSSNNGNNNIAIGYQAGDNITTGSKNIIIGSDIDAPSAIADNQLSIGNLIFGTGLDGTGTTISTGNIGIGTAAPSTRLEVAGGAIKATGGLIIQTCTVAAADCPAAPVDGQMWLCTDC